MHRLKLKWRMKLGRFWSPLSLVGQLPCRYRSLLVMIVWLISLRIGLGFLLAPFICFEMGRLGGMRMGFGGWMLCGWLGVCLVVLVLLLSLFRVNGRARRVVWRGAGQVRCVAFGAWLRDLWSVVRTRLVRCLGRAMRGNVRILGNLPLRGIRRIRRFGICLMPVLRHLCLWVLFLQRLPRWWI